MDIILLNQQQCLPKYWTLPMLTNFSRHTLYPQSTEYIFVADKFNQSWANFNNQSPTVPAPPPPPPSIPVRLHPPQPSVLVPSANNLPSSNLSAALLRFASMQPPINNSNGSITNQPPAPPPPNHTFGPLTYSMPLAANTIIQPASLPQFGPPPPPPPLPPPSVPVPYSAQQMYPPSNPYTRSRSLHRLRVNNPTLPTRHTRNCNHISNLPKIIQIERIQNQRWYKQYSAHECEFRQKLGKQTEQWLFHG